jgi:hypothetical protein
MMKGTPCSRSRDAQLKTLSKTRYFARSSNPAKRVRAWVTGPARRGYSEGAAVPCWPGAITPMPNAHLMPALIARDGEQAQVVLTSVQASNVVDSAMLRTSSWDHASIVRGGRTTRATANAPRMATPPARIKAEVNPPLD